MTCSLLLRRTLLALIALLTIGLGAGHAAAHGEFDGDVYPENEEVLPQTPEEIVIVSTDPAQVTVTLKRADGAVVYFTGEPVLDSDAVSLTPPVLEPGTYILTWRDGGEQQTSVFSVDRPDAEVSTTGRSGLPGLLAVIIMLLSTWVTGLLIGRTPLNAERGAVLALATVPGAAAGWLLLPGTTPASWAVTALFALGAVGIAAGAAAGGVRNASSRTRLIWAGGAVALTACFPIAAVIGGSGIVAIVGALVGALVVTLGGLVAATRVVQRSFGVVRAVPAITALVVSGALLAGGGTEIKIIEAAATEASVCLDAGNRLEIQRCLEGSFVGIARERDVNSALQSLEQLMEQQGQVRYFCHEVSHAIGRTSLRINGTIAAAFRDGYDACDFGYYHGIVEGAAAGFDDAQFTNAMSELCSNFASAEDLFFLQCTHGLGHAAARRTNSDMLRALAFCDAIDDAGGLTGVKLANARNGCGTGVTMEWFATATLTENPPVTPKVERPRDVCHQVPTEWAAECYEYVGNTLDAADPVSSLQELGAWCSASPQTGPCYKGLARAAAGVGLSDRDAIAVCDSAATTTDRDGCVTYYIATVATTIDFSVDAVTKICALLPERDRVGSESLCERVKLAVTEVLASGDGK